jgi:hypothetical protein
MMLLMSRVYEEELNRSFDWALREGSMHFEQNSAVHKTMRTLAQRLDALGIPYAVVGGMAMFAHGYRRFTEDVDLVVTRESMQRIRDELEGLGYVQPAGTSTKLRDTSTGVRIEFLITGQYPGDGKPKNVAFPDPAQVATIVDGVQVLNLPKLIELKLASGLSAPHRMKDLTDVFELIRVLKLNESMADQLDASVRAKYLELWRTVRDAPADD